MASYYLWSGATGSANGTSWANAYTTLTTAFSGHTAGDTYYVAHDHNEVSGTGLGLTSLGTAAAPTKVVCVDRAGSVPPVSADRRTTAQISTNATANINFQNYTHYDGIIFTAGAGASSGGLGGFSNNAQTYRFDNCSLRLGGSNAAAKIAIGATSLVYAKHFEFNNTTVSMANVGQSIIIGGTLRWRNTPSALLGTIPTTLFTMASGYGGEVECIGVDLSAAGSGKTIVGALSDAIMTKFKFVDCKLNASVTKSTVPGGIGTHEVDFIRSGASVNYAVYRHRMTGSLAEETTIVRTGGASDGTTPISWAITTTANCSYSVPFECPPIAVWNDTTGSARTATVEGIWGGGAVPNDDDVWVDLEYLGDASSPQASFVNDGKANLLTTAAAQTSSSETWGGSTTKFKMNVTFTAQKKGWVYARVKCAKASTTFYVDPLITLT